MPLAPSTGRSARPWRARCVGLGIGLLTSIAVLPPLHAHRIFADAFLRDRAILVEAYFSDDSPLREARVTVHGPDGAILAEDQTDQEGRFRYSPERAIDIVVVIDDGLGHRLEVDIPAERIEPLLTAEPATDGRSAPIAKSNRPGLSAFGPLWARVTLGLLAIASLTFLATWLHRKRRGEGAR